MDNARRSSPQVTTPGGKDAHIATKTDDQNKNSQIQYKRFSSNKTDKNTNKCHCPACIDSGFQYGNNPVLIEDDNERIHIFKVLER
jgi:hypothetical protein